MIIVLFQRTPSGDVTQERGVTTTSETGSIGTAVLGAGPAGLTAAYVLGRRGCPAVVFEGSNAVGGISRTVECDGYRFDLGGHRFFTKLTPVARMWEDVLGDDFLTRPRLSRIYYKGNFLAYPLVAEDVVSRLGVVEADAVPEYDIRVIDRRQVARRRLEVMRI